MIVKGGGRLEVKRLVEVNCIEIMEEDWMRVVEVIKNIKNASENSYLCRVVGASEVDRLFEAGELSEAQRDAAERFHRDWRRSGIGGHGRTSWERSGSSAWNGGSYENIDAGEDAWIEYCWARRAVDSGYIKVVCDVVLYDLACGSIVALQRGLEQLVKHYKLQ